MSTKPSNTENIVKKNVEVIMYDDDYETKYGDGYYPQMEKYKGKDSDYPAKTINFELIELNINSEKKSIWYQTSNISILGLDGDNCGKLLCNRLNSELDSIPTIIYNREYKQIYPK
jgi:hypothetical protein